MTLRDDYADVALQCVVELQRALECPRQDSNLQPTDQWALCA